jgi:hypothetical protein
MLLAALFLVASCARMRVRTDYDRQVDFEQYRSFAWVDAPERPDPNPFEDNSLLRKRVREAVQAEMVRRGFVSVPVEDADLLVTFHVVVQDRVRSRGSGGFVFVDRHAGHDGVDAVVGATNDVYSYQEGTLILDLIDPDLEQLVWRGWGRNAVPTTDIETDRVDLAVTQILTRFPPGR